MTSHIDRASLGIQILKVLDHRNPAVDPIGHIVHDFLGIQDIPGYLYLLPLT